MSESPLHSSLPPDTSSVGVVGPQKCSSGTCAMGSVQRGWRGDLGLISVYVHACACVCVCMCVCVHTFWGSLLSQCCCLMSHLS